MDEVKHFINLVQEHGVIGSPFSFNSFERVVKSIEDLISDPRLEVDFEFEKKDNFVARCFWYDPIRRRGGCMEIPKNKKSSEKHLTNV